jgi:hypothetical protein
MGRRHKKQDARVGARANPYERSDALCRPHSPVISIGQGSGNAIARWQAGLDDERCRAILKALYDANAYSPRFALSARAIGKLTGLHHQVIKRLIRGDKGCRAKLMGLVAWQTGGKGQKTPQDIG